MQHLWTALFLSLMFVIAPFSATAAAQDAAPAQKSKKLTDAQIKKLLIEASIEAYPGNCPCPYNRAANHSKCGRRSAWSRDGGYAPLCYPDDVTQEMVQQFRLQQEGM